MRRASLAEWILSLVTAPERAASIAGDLVEEASVRGKLWFWYNVMRIAASHFLRDPHWGEAKLGLVFGFIIGGLWSGLLVVGNLAGTSVFGNFRDHHPGNYGELMAVFPLAAIIVTVLTGVAAARRTGSILGALRVSAFAGFVSGAICLIVIMSITILFHDAMMLDPSNIHEFARSAKRPPTQAELSHFLYWDALGGGLNMMLWLLPLAGLALGALGVLFGNATFPGDRNRVPLAG